MSEKIMGKEDGPFQVEVSGVSLPLQEALPLWEKDRVPDTLIGQRGICRTAYHQIRTAPGEAAEQEAQLTFGEVYTVRALSEDRKWVQIERACDGTIGWMDEHRHRLAQMSEEEFEELSTEDHAFVASRKFTVEDSRGRIIALGVGALLPFYDDRQKTCRVAGVVYRVREGEVLVGVQHPRKKTLLSLLEQFSGVVYEWGGDTSFGTDCSGLIRTIYRIFGVQLPRNSGPQSKHGESIAYEQCQTGDLLFFGTKGRERIHHVGIALRAEDGHLYLFHAGPGELQCVPIDEHGIYPHSDRSREFRFAKRIVLFRDE